MSTNSFHPKTSDIILFMVNYLSLQMWSVEAYTLYLQCILKIVVAMEIATCIRIIMYLVWHDVKYKKHYFVVFLVVNLLL